MTQKTTGIVAIADSKYVLTLLSGEFKTQFQALAELINNSLGAEATNIRIVIDRAGRRSTLSVGDDGNGIPYRILSRLGESVGDSIKRRDSSWSAKDKALFASLSKERTTGVHGLGMPTAALRFGASRLEVISLAKGETVAWKLTFDFSGNQITYNLEKMPYWKDQGTVVTFHGIPTKDMNDFVKQVFPKRSRKNEPRIIQQLRLAYGTAIAKNQLRIYVQLRSSRGRPKETEIKALSFLGTPIRVSPIDTPSGRIEFNLFKKVPSSTGTIVVQHATGPVLMSILELKDFNGSPWKHFEGEVFAPFLKRTAAGISENNKAYHHFRDALKEVEVMLQKMLKERDAETFTKAEAATLRDIFARALPNSRLDQIDLPRTLALASESDRVKEQDEVKAAHRSRLGQSPSRKIKSRADESRGLDIPDDSNYRPFATPQENNPIDRRGGTRSRRNNTPTTKTNNLQWNIGPFSTDKRMLRYEIREGVIFINTLHPDYIARINVDVEPKKRIKLKLSYMAMVTCIVIVDINMPLGPYSQDEIRMHTMQLFELVADNLK